MGLRSTSSYNAYNLLKHRPLISPGPPLKILLQFLQMYFHELIMEAVPHKHAKAPRTKIPLTFLTIYTKLSHKDTARPPWNSSYISYNFHDLYPKLKHRDTPRTAPNLSYLSYNLYQAHTDRHGSGTPLNFLLHFLQFYRPIAYRPVSFQNSLTFLTILPTL